jgi:hypothetical protein
MRFLAHALFTLILLTAATAANAATVSGNVTSSATGQRLGGMVVQAYDAAGILRGVATTDLTGLYVLTLPVGQYRVLAFDPTGIYATMFDANAESFETSPLRSIPAGGASISFALVEGGALSGTVHTTSGTQLPDAIVEAYNLSGTRRGFTTTNAAGEFKLVVPPGDYKLIAYDATGTYAASFHSGAQSFGEATPVRVVPSANTTVDFTLATAAQISGRAVDATTGAALASITVYAYTPAGALVATTITDAAGFFRLSLPAGDYRLVAADAARAYANAYYDRASSFQAANVVTLLTGEQRADLQLALTRGARITGHVNAPNLVVAAYNLDGTLHVSTTSDANGNYTLVVVPGEYRIAVSDPSLTYAALFYGGSTDFRVAQRLTVTGDMTGIDVTLPRGGRITGIVRSNTSQPLIGMTVGAYDIQGTLAASAITGGDGRYSLVVAPGLYRVVAFDPTLIYATSYAGGALSYETTGPVSVQADVTITADFTMRRGVRISGSVTTPFGTPADDIEIFALDASGNRIAGAVSSDGTFTIVVPPGTYRLIALDPHRRYAASEPSAFITVTQGQTPAPIALTLQAASRRRAVRH